jgi:aminoglycoside 3-N-acetyltransferase
VVVPECKVLRVTPANKAPAGRPAFEAKVRSVIGALTHLCGGIMMPTFTYNTMVVPEDGPENNGLAYGSRNEHNGLAELWSPDMHADPMMGVIPETLRQMDGAERSTHPVLSFAAIGLSEALATQSLEEPLAPIGWLADREGEVLLLGVDHTRNTAIHFGERRAGRKQLVRWALTPEGALECPNFPGDSDGFAAIAPRLAGVARFTSVGQAVLQRIPLRDLLHIVEGWIREDPQALLCARPECERCNSVRAESNLSARG